MHPTYYHLFIVDFFNFEFLPCHKTHSVDNSNYQVVVCFQWQVAYLVVSCQSNDNYFSNTGSCLFSRWSDENCAFNARWSLTWRTGWISNPCLQCCKRTLYYWAISAVFMVCQNINFIGLHSNLRDFNLRKRSYPMAYTNKRRCPQIETFC